MTQQRIRGVLSPVVTPFNRDLSPDPERFIAHCRWLLSQNCGLAVFGTNSEGNSLSVNERIALLDALGGRMVFDLFDLQEDPELADDLFRFEPPAGVEVIESR